MNRCGSISLIFFIIHLINLINQYPINNSDNIDQPIRLANIYIDNVVLYIGIGLRFNIDVH